MFDHLKLRHMHIYNAKHAETCWNIRKKFEARKKADKFEARKEIAHDENTRPPSLRMPHPALTAASLFAPNWRRKCFQVDITLQG